MYLSIYENEDYINMAYNNGKLNNLYYLVDRHSEVFGHISTIITRKVSK